MRRAATLACLLIPLCLAACNRDAPPTDAVPTPDAAPAPWANDPSALRIETDVRKLADDAMEGRETGTRGYRMASAYVAERLAGIRSEEHTSELQSPMRISYAVFRSHNKTTPPHPTPPPTP